MEILFGYSEVDYRVLLGGKITIARHVEDIETDTKCIGLVENSFDKDNDDIEDNDLLVNMNKEELGSREDENDNSLESLNIPGRSTRNKRTPVRYPEKEKKRIFLYVSVFVSIRFFKYTAVHSIYSQYLLCTFASANKERAMSITVLLYLSVVPFNSCT